MPTPPIQRFLTQASLAKETTWGTGVGASSADQFLPVISITPAEDYDPIDDQSFRNRASQQQGYQYGFGQGSLKFDMQAFPDVCGNIFTGLLGLDTPTTSGTTTSHAITVVNSGLPPSYTFDDFSAVDGSSTARRFAGMYVDTVQLTGSGTGPMKMAVTVSGGKTATTIAKIASNFTSTSPFIPYQAAVTLNSVSNAKLISYDITLKRQVEAILAMGSQFPSAANSGWFSVTGKLVFAPTDTTEFYLYATANQAAFPLKFVWTSGTNVLTLQMSSINFLKGTQLDRSGEYVKINANFVAIDNATDAGACKVVLVNSLSRTY